MSKEELISTYGADCVKYVGGWAYCVGADKYDEDNWGIDVFNDYGELVCSLLHKSFSDFKDDEDMAQYVANYIDECIY